MSDFHVYEPSKGHGLSHDPFNAIVGPRPIGWISSIGADGGVNLAPYSFFNGFNYKPPIIGFASLGWKDTVRNISETRIFAWNLATASLAEAMNATSDSVGSGVDEFDLAGLTKAPSRRIGVPRVLESPVSFECEVTQITRLTDVSGQPLETWLVLGEVVAVHIDKLLLKDGVYDTARAGHILRAGGLGDYFTVGPDQYFHMTRPARRE
jgi:flavin reductase (DIM6/NTAB) family NADH-FMN oxidoreductase RutF